MKETLKTIINGLLIKMRTFRGDWNQNDPSASNYISNRPFYTEHDVETEVLPETVLTSEEVTLTTPLIKGQTYKVYWNSVEYECVAREYDGYLMLGNNAIYEYDGGIETDTGEPFAMETAIGGVGLYIYVQSSPMRADSSDSEANPTLRITTIGSVIHKINKKYLPDLNYITEADLNDRGYLTYIPSEYITETELNNKKYLTAVPSEYITETELNNKGYLTSQSQVDWLEDDETSASFIHNRPCYLNILEVMYNSREDLSYRVSDLNEESFTCNTSFVYPKTHDTIVFRIGEEYIEVQSSIYRHQIGAGTGQTADYHYFGNLWLSNKIFPNTGESFLLSKGTGTTYSVYFSEVPTTSWTIYNGTTKRISSSFLPNSNLLNGDGVGSVKTIRAEKASGNYSSAEGYNTTASGNGSHAEGYNTTASGSISHAEGNHTTASGDYSHAEGGSTIASGPYSHAEGWGTIASKINQHVQGCYNIGDSQGIYLHIVGNGTDALNRSNAHTLDKLGNAWFAGTVEGVACILASSTEGSTKRFKITVDDSGTLSAIEITE